MNTNEFKSDCSDAFIAVNHCEASLLEISRDCAIMLFPGEFPFCGNCIHYSGPGVCPVANVPVDSSSDGAGCVLSGVYQKKHITEESSM